VTGIYPLIVVLEGDLSVSPRERVVGCVIPCDVINPVRLVVVSEERKVLNYNNVLTLHCRGKYATTSCPWNI